MGVKNEPFFEKFDLEALFGENQDLVNSKSITKIKEKFRHTGISRKI